MAYVYGYAPPIPEESSEPFQLCSARQTGLVCPLMLILAGGAGALMVGFFETRKEVIWPIISSGIVLCALGVFLARRHVRYWREMEQERQRAMWRPLTFERIGNVASRAQGAVPLFDLPMYCLEAPSRPLRPMAHPKGGALESPFGAVQCQTDSGSEDWFALGVPLRPDDVSGGQYLYWAAMALVIQPAYKYCVAEGAGGGSASPVAGVVGAGPTLRITRSGGLRSGVDRAGPSIELEPVLSAPSLTLLRTTSAGLWGGGTSGVGVAGGGSDVRGGGPSRSGMVGELLSTLFATIGGGAGGGGGGASPARMDLAVTSGAAGGGGGSGHVKAVSLARGRSLPLPPVSSGVELLAEPAARAAGATAGPLANRPNRGTGLTSGDCEGEGGRSSTSISTSGSSGGGTGGSTGGGAAPSISGGSYYSTANRDEKGMEVRIRESPV